MVGYNPDLKISKDEQAIAGGLSNGVARLVTQPFDVLKIRFQVNMCISGVFTSLGISRVISLFVG